MITRYVAVLVFTVLMVMFICAADFSHREGTRLGFYVCLAAALFLAAAWIIQIYQCSIGVPL